MWCYTIFAITLTFNYVTGHLAFWNTQNQLRPVQGLYVKPSTDGTTGDLYVAATEENGVKSQWLTDQPVNFFPIAAASQAQPAIVPMSYSPSLTAAVTPQDDTLVTTQKRAVITSPTMKYTYAIPVPGKNDGSPITTYPYAVPVSNASPPTEGTPTSCVAEGIPSTTSFPHYSPFHYFYPQLISAAFANAMNVMKESGVGEDGSSSITPQATPMWSPPSYAYPFQYIMVDPNTWAQSQAALSSSTADKTVNENPKPQ